MRQVVQVLMVATLLGSGVGEAQQFPTSPSFMPAGTSFSNTLADGFRLGDRFETGQPIGGSLLLAGPNPLQQNCSECDQPRQFWSGFYQLMIVQLIPWSYNRFVRDAEFARISPSTWWTNLENPWLWDNNEFKNNQFSHPYHGSLYFNAGRANGYTFWESWLWAGGGSLMWEWFGEAWAPAPNDWWNTTLGGVALGEMLWRVSSLTLDNGSSGFERGMRETGATLLNPVRGFNRLIRGDMTGQRENPEEWRPGKVFTSFDFGYRGSADFVEPGSKNEQFTAHMLLSYGDRIEDADKQPFSTFLGGADACKQPGQRWCPQYAHGEWESVGHALCRRGDQGRDPGCPDDLRVPELLGVSIWRDGIPPWAALQHW